MLRPLYYDTETTGVRADKDRIIEIAVFDPVQGREFVRLINPGVPVPAEATAIHSITDEMLAGASSFAVVGAELVEFCGKENALLIAHNNANFDLPFLKQEFQRNQLEFPSEWKFLDSLKWARKYRRDLPQHSLQFLRQVFQIPENQAHRAMEDVKVLFQVFSKMIDDLSFDTIYALLDGSLNPREITQMPFGKHQGKPLEGIPKDYVVWLAGQGAFEKEENQSLKEAFQKLGYLTEPVLV